MLGRHPAGRGGHLAHSIDCSGPARDPNCPPYTVLAKKDLSHAVADRMVVSIRVEGPVNETEIEAICKDILARHGDVEAQDAVGFFFYLPESNPTSHYTTGLADWAPFGDWTKADRERDKSDHRLSIKVGNAYGTTAPAIASRIPKEERQRIYREYRAEEDRLGDVKKARLAVARRNKITRDDLNRIALEGLYMGWEE